MKQNNTVEEPILLSKYGWTFYEKCRCNSVLKYKYTCTTHPGLVLEWWVKYSQFKISYRESSTKVPLTKLSLLEKTLQSL